MLPSTGSKTSNRALLAASILVVLLSTAVAKPLPQEPIYHNPVLYADYSDPDVIRDGSHYYLVASTFHFVPGIPILASTDLVHWTILGHVLPRIDLEPRYDMIGGNRYGGGVWAPSIRRHNGLFYVYFPTPDEGIFVCTAPKITGPWSKPVAVISGSGYEDPCPFWDTDGQAYLVHSRLGAGPLILHRMALDGKSVLDKGIEIIRDDVNLPTLEGPKFYKRNGYYYIFAPFGGVGSGSQAVLRSKSIYGPYEHRAVLSQGSTEVNGPHQGGYVETRDGQGWFVHFRDTGAHGRIVYLEPVRWENDWPIIGQAPPGAEGGVPVSSWPVPHHSSSDSNQRPQMSDEFNRRQLGPQWEWNHNPDDAFWSLSKHPGFLRLVPNQAKSLVEARNTLTQQMQARSFQFTTRLDLQGMAEGVHAGVAMLQQSPSGVQAVEKDGKISLNFFSQGKEEQGPTIPSATIDLRLEVTGNEVVYEYSLDQGKIFTHLGVKISIISSWWKGSRPALFCYSTSKAKEACADFDWVRVNPLP